MALEFRTLRLRIRARTAGLVDDAVIESLARDKIKELYESWSYSFRFAEGVLATVPTKSDGTVSLNADPTLVDGIGTSFALTDQGKELRVGNTNSRYTVQSVNVSTQQLTLAAAYVGVAFSASPYILQQSVYSLANDFLDMLSVTYWRFLTESTPQTLDRYDGRRAFTSQLPFSWTYKGLDGNGVQQIEISPVPSAALGIHYTYRRAMPLLTEGTIIPFREDVLSYLCAADALTTKAIELAEKNPAAAQILMDRADKYQAIGQNALAEFQFADLRRSGAAKGVRDEREGGMVSDDMLVSHDLFTPIR
jgi:hypothetical protein